MRRYRQPPLFQRIQYKVTEVLERFPGSKAETLDQMAVHRSEYIHSHTG